MAFLVFLATIFVLAAPPVHVVVGQEPGFLSIDCGLDDKYSGYTDLSTGGITYVSDGPYVDTGENHKVAADMYMPSGRRFETVRSFPSDVRSCYSLPTTTEAGAKYLLRLDAYYGNYDGKNDSNIEFDLHLGANYWDTMAVQDNAFYEAVFVPWASWTPVCLLNTGRGTPFLSYLELRRLPGTLYPNATISQGLNAYTRANMGGVNIRYPADKYDRVWSGSVGPEWENMTISENIQQDPSYMEPPPVLRTAVTAANNGTMFNYTWKDNRRGYSFMVLLHFADSQSAKSRQFNVYFGGNQLSGLSAKPYSPAYLASSSLYSGWYTAHDVDGAYNITLAATAASVLPPMCNAIEIYTRIPLDGPATYPNDFDAIMAIKMEYGVKKNWMGDPCFPAKFAWEGVICSASGNTSRITSLDLSNSYLRGAISKNFTLLTALMNLDLSNNSLSGSIPNSLLNLPSLRVLNVSANQLSDDSLCKNYTGSLIFRHDSNKSTCNKKITSRKNTVILVTSVAAAVLVVSTIVLAYFICRAKRKSTVYVDDHTRNAQLEIAPRSRTDQGDHLQDNENRRFTYKDLEKFTDNFKQFIGQGGFGVVYFGHLEDGTEVAVKMRSESSSHGLDEFLAEVQSLTKVHHRNIVSLVGYCWEKDHLALVYEYMSQGNLYDHLRGKIAAAEALNWGTRVRMVLEAAQGLDYLHKGCSPPIIHRDVKSSNILLGQNLQAKVADLGLSKTYISDGHTHISATAAGTAGYMDPEYYFTGRLTESSDVYSFGVVLLEAATGEPPLVPGQGHIVQRVKQRVSATGDIASVADPRLGAAYDVNSMWKVVDTAMACTAESGAGRPTMAEVVAQLKDSLALEYARDNDDDRSVPASIAASDSAALMMSGFGPSAR